MDDLLLALAKAALEYLFKVISSYFKITFLDFNDFPSLLMPDETLSALLDSILYFSLESINESTSKTLIDTEIVARRLGSGLATSGLSGVGAGIGLVFSGLIKGFSWNPSLKDDLFNYAIFGFALTEAIGLFALMLAFMLLYA